MTATHPSTQSYDVVVIGAGQAGLAVGYFLARQRKRFLIVDAADSVGAAWRARWDSLLLFTPRRYDSLPGLAFRSEEHTSELQSQSNLVCRLLLEKKMLVV